MRIMCVLGLTMSMACSQSITVDWKSELPGPSESTPLVTDAFIAVGHEVGLSVLEKNGAERCVFNKGRDVISAPKTDGKRIFFGCTNYMFYAIDSGCTEVWSFPAGDRIKSDPLVADGKVYLASYDGHLYALKADTGEEVWRFPVVSVPMGSDLLAVPVPEPTKSAKLSKARRRAKHKATELSPPPPVAKPKSLVVGGFSYSSPILEQGVIYIGNLDHNLYAIDANTGEMRGRFSTNGQITSTPVADNGMLYFGSNDGSVYAIDLETNTQLWSFSTQDWVNSSGRVGDGALYIGSNDRHIYALEAISGKLRWKFETTGPAVAIPALYKNLVVAAGASGDGAIYALQRNDGALFWKYETGGSIESDPVIVGDTVFVSSADRNVYKLKIERTTADR